MSKKKKGLPKNLKLDLDKWICGLPNEFGSKKDNCLGQGCTALENTHGYQCCLGQFLSQVGVDVSGGGHEDK